MATTLDQRIAQYQLSEQQQCNPNLNLYRQENTYHVITPATQSSSPTTSLQPNFNQLSAYPSLHSDHHAIYHADYQLSHPSHRADIHHQINPLTPLITTGYHVPETSQLPSPDDGPSAHNEEESPLVGDPKIIDVKRQRACDSCRGLKVKCILVPGTTCRRCTKAGRKCIVTPPTKKRKKRPDNRVAELERKIDALTATLAQHNGKLPDGQSDSSSKQDCDSRSSSPDDSIASSFARPPKRHRLTNLIDNPHEPVLLGSADDIITQRIVSGVNIYNQSRPLTYDHSDIDENLNRIVSPEIAEQLFDRYVEVICPQFPAVPFPPGTKAEDVRKKKPILFLAILSGTSYGAGVPAETQQELERQFRDVIATCIWKTGEKSLQLIQALQVGALWYRPPANFEQHMFYQMVHMSAIMAIDIGIGRRKSAWKKHYGKRPNDPQVELVRKEYLQKVGIPDFDDAEARRAWLVNYFLCITITMILRRPILLRYNDFMKECLETLETSEGALPSDKLLCQHVQHARVLEDIAVQFAMDDPAVNLSLSDGKVSYGIKHHEQALADLMARNIEDASIQLSGHITNLYLHEIALHNHSNVDEFKTPFTEESFVASAQNNVLNEHHVDALIECQNSCKKVIESFLSIDKDIIFVLPVIFSVRMIYAVVVLIKLYISATTPGEIGNVINSKDLRLEENIGRLEAAFQQIVDRDRLTPHTKFLYVIQRLRDRYRTIQRQQEDKAKTYSHERKHKNGAKQPSLSSSSSSSSPSRPRINSRHARLGSQSLKEARELHLLSEAAVSSSVLPSALAVPTTPTVSHQLGLMLGGLLSANQQNTLPASLAHLIQPQAQAPSQTQQPLNTHTWYTQSSPIGTNSNGTAMDNGVGGNHQTQQQLQQQLDGMFDGDEQFQLLTGFEVFDFGLGGLGMIDGSMTGLFMDPTAGWGGLGNGGDYFDSAWNC